MRRSPSPVHYLSPPPRINCYRIRHGDSILAAVDVRGEGIFHIPDLLIVDGKMFFRSHITNADREAGVIDVYVKEIPH